MLIGVLRGGASGNDLTTWLRACMCRNVCVGEPRGNQLIAVKCMQANPSLPQSLFNQTMNLRVLSSIIQWMTQICVMVCVVEDPFQLSSPKLGYTIPSTYPTKPHVSSIN